MNGEFNVTGDLASLFITGGLGEFGKVVVGNNVTGVLQVMQSQIGPGEVRVHGDLSGSFQAASGMSCKLRVGQMSGVVLIGTGGNGDLIANMTVDEDMSGSVTIEHDLNGYIHIGGDLTGTITIKHDANAPINVAGDLFDEGQDQSGGHIIINGAFGSDNAIVIDGQLVGDTEFITIDYDGWDDGDKWGQDAYVTIDQTTYWGNTPAAKVYSTSGCKGDLNNDDTVDFADIDAFVLGLNQSAYEAAYPGLAGSRVFHGDTNCDGFYDFDDLDSFVARIGQPCDPGCPERGAGEPLPPLQLATAMATHVAPERHAALATMVLDVANRQQDEQRAAYWRAVWEYLTE